MNNIYIIMVFFSNLTLENFRNIRSATLSFHPEFNIFYGKNGAGKTNLLEALHFLCLGKSQRHARIRDMVTFDRDRFCLSAEYSINGVSKNIGAEGSGRGHRFFSGNTVLKSAADLVGNIGVVSFAPDDLLLTSGPPLERRRYINMLLSQSDINYFISLREYNRTLLQRNVYLKSNVSDKNYLSVLTETLLKYGAEIRTKRVLFIDTILPLADRQLHAISSGTEKLLLTLSSGSRRQHENNLHALRAEFKRVEKQEQVLLQTLFGPHRDELTIQVNGREARCFASRGQHRSISLALKLAAVDYFREKCGEKVVLLLDDIFSELDSTRCRLLLDVFAGNSQIFTTVPRRLGFEIGNRKSEFYIDNGIVKTEDGIAETQEK